MLLSLWFFVVLISAAAAGFVLLVTFEVQHRRGRRSGRRVMRGLRLHSVRLVGVVATLAMALAATADGVNRHFSYIPTFAALFGDISPDYMHHHHGTIEEALGARGRRPHPWRGRQGDRRRHRLAPWGRDTYVYLPAAYLRSGRGGPPVPDALPHPRVAGHVRGLATGRIPRPHDGRTPAEAPSNRSSSSCRTSTVTTGATSSVRTSCTGHRRRRT